MQIQYGAMSACTKVMFLVRQITSASRTQPIRLSTKDLIMMFLDIVFLLCFSFDGESITRCLSQNRHTDHEKNAQGVTLDVYDPDKPVFSD